MSAAYRTAAYRTAEIERCARECAREAWGQASRDDRADSAEWEPQPLDFEWLCDRELRISQSELPYEAMLAFEAAYAAELDLLREEMRS